MGLGRYRDGLFDLIVVANFEMSDADWTEWRRSFEKASELFFDASEGQIQFGRIFICDESIGLDSAEIILHAAGDPSYGTWGEFGEPGAALHLMPYVKRQVLTHLHEMGHHVWALGEEYAGAAAFDEIDTSVVPPNNATVPLVGSDFADGELVGVDAILRFDDLLERREIQANDANSLTVNPAFPQDPTNDSDGFVQYQFEAECATEGDANFCIMENSRGAAGTFDAAGTWNPAANPVTEFCTDSNHDPDGNTQQESRNADSCWETIISAPGFDTLELPNPAIAGPAVGAVAPEWIVLDKQSRFAVIVDRSGSMSAGHRMADARYGAIYWLEVCAVEDDLLSVVAYDDLIEPILELTEVSTLGGLDATRTAIGDLTPRGATNIRDALFEARDQIESRPTRAAVQVALLLTDGRHNTPTGSSPLEALPVFQDGGIRLYTLGVGDPAAVEMDVLDALAIGTGGRSYGVGDDEPAAIEAAMIAINAEVRGGIITTEPVLFPDSKAGAVDRLFKPLIDKNKGRVPPKSRPKLEKVLEALGVGGINDLKKLGKKRLSRAVVIPVDVENDADRASFAVVHPGLVDVWLYLINPNGQPVVSSASGVSHVESPAPHEFIIVQKPMPGRWLVVAIRAGSGASTVGRLIAGGENRHLQVFGSAAPLTPAGYPVRLTASARWEHELTNLSVTALITSPSGARTRVKLRDDLVGRGDGKYEGHFKPSEVGRHQGVITIKGSPRASVADAARLLLHSESGKVDMAVKVPRFVRRVVVTFDVGTRPKAKDGTEKRAQKQWIRPRKIQLTSAKKRRR